MANQPVKFRKGVSTSLPKTPTNETVGAFLLETDTGNLYVDESSTSRIQIKDNTKADKDHNHDARYIGVTDSRTANTVLAAPDGTAGGATFRKLTMNDIPRNYLHYYTGQQYEKGYYKIKIKSLESWMLSIHIRIYQNYQNTDLVISGYNYINGKQHWYCPEATILGSSLDSIQIVFGYDSDDYLWFTIPANWYSGIDIVNVVSGFNNLITNFDNLFEITYTETEPTTVQARVTAYRPYLKSDFSLSDITNKASVTHIHGNITNDGKVGTVANKVLTTSTDGAIVASDEGTAFNKNFETSTSNIKSNGTVSVGTSTNVARADHVHPTDTTRAKAEDLTKHTGDKVSHITATERDTWNNKQDALVSGTDYLTSTVISSTYLKKNPDGTNNLIGTDNKINSVYLPTTNIPTTLPNPQSLTIQGNSTTAFTYNGSASKTLNIKPGTNVSVSSDTSGNITISATNTDTKVTSVDNHYSPTGTTTLSASGATATEITNSSNIQVVTGVTTDTKGHTTSVESIGLKIPEIPEIPITLPNENPLTIQINDGTVEGTDLFIYDGSENTSINIKSGEYVTVSSDSSGSITIEGNYKLATSEKLGLVKLSGELGDSPDTTVTQHLVSSKVEELDTKIEALNTKIDGYTQSSDISDYVRCADKVIETGYVDNTYTQVIDNNKISFNQGDTTIASIHDNKVESENIVVHNSINIGDEDSGIFEILVDSANGFIIR